MRTADLSAYCTDWTGRWVGLSPVVVAPANPLQVASILRICTEFGVGVVPQGGNTGLVGGGVPYGEVVLDLRRLDSVDVDPVAGQVRAGAGATVAAVQAAARAAGLRYGVDLASRDSATIGGTIATNAAGLRAVRLGDTRAQLIDVEAVLSTGTVLSRRSGLTRDNSGYDLPRWLCGSEGTLAVVTAARLRLLPDPAARATALLAFADVAGAVTAAAALRRDAAVEVLELMLAPGVRLVCEQHGLAAPFPTEHPVLLLVEATAAANAGARLGVLVEDLAGLVDAAVGVDAADARRLWAYRELHTESVGRVGVPHKLDVALPLPAFAAFVDEVPTLLAHRWPAAAPWMWGHVGEGNLHLNVTGVDPDDDDLDDAVLRMVAEAGGSISAEHGIGRAKQRWLPLVRGAEELAVWRAVKHAFDPTGTLNPGVLLPI
ncbi:MAG TPA: FAD-binding oxidoreductase [Sporichthya sp.]|nr:FAD-binding oxidoreductase [Sporichthya sp.]